MFEISRTVTRGNFGSNNDGICSAIFKGILARHNMEMNI